MQIAKWGNSLAIRIPANIAKALSLKEGDEVQIQPSSDGFAVTKAIQSIDRRRLL